MQITAFSQQDDEGILQNDNFNENELNEGLKAKLGLTARTYSDSVILRWSVSKPGIWIKSKELGFTIERASILNGSTGEFKPLSDSSIKPWNEAQWSSFFDSNPRSLDPKQINYEGIAYLFGVNNDEDPESGLEKLNGDELKEIKQKKSKLDWQFLSVLLSANNSRVAAEGLGLRFVDKNVKEGEKYVYRIFLSGDPGDYMVDTGKIDVTIENFNNNFANSEITPAENDQSIGLSWKANNQLTTYNVERSDDNGKTYTKLNKAPLLTMRPSLDVTDLMEGYLDTNIINYKPYKYKIFGTTAFADEVLIGEVTAMGRDRTPPEAPFLPQPKHIDNEIKLIWEMGNSPAKDLAGFYIGRDTSTSGDFKNLNTTMLPSSAREFIDKSFLHEGSNYYIVRAVDTAGNVSLSYPAYVALNDTTPPVRPDWVSGKMDSNGVVTLTIKQNTEKDLMGYRILSSNSPEHEFASIFESFGEDTIDYTTITEFKDTVSLETTTKYSYYTFTALDNRFNESQQSEILAVPRPDIIAPVPPVVTDVSVNDNSVTLLFAPSSSEDVKYQVAFKRLNGDEKWDSVTSLKSNDSVFTDKNVKQNTMYEYTLLAVDSSGLRSEYAFPVTGRPYFTGVMPGISDLKASYDASSNTAKLTWRYEVMNKEFNFCIYRSYKENGLTKYSYLENSSSREFADKEFNKGKGNYSYAIKVFAKDGGESKLSNPVMILVK